MLRRIDEHLLLYHSKKAQKVLAFLNPNSFTQKLREDQRQLGHQLHILTAAIGIVGYFRDHDRRSDQAQVVSTSTLEISNDNDTLKIGISNAISELQTAVDAQEFWRDYIGVKAIRFSTLCSVLALLMYDSC